MSISAGWTVLGACLLAACGGPTQPNMVPGPPVQRPESPGASLAGSYDLTIGIPDRCAEAAGIPQTLVYAATLDATPFGYLSMSIGTAARGDVWPQGTTSVRLSLNNFDINGCDGAPERLPDGRLFNICATGALAVSGPTIAGSVEGTTWMGAGQSVTGLCSGAHHFTFTRRTP